jgi:hypothetical protein
METYKTIGRLVRLPSLTLAPSLLTLLSMQAAGASTRADRSTFELVAPALAAASSSAIPSSGSGGGPAGLAESAAASARAHRKYLMNLYPKEYWWSIAGFVGVLAVLHLAGLVSTWIILRPARVRPSSPPDDEKGSVARPLAPSLSSVPVRAWRSARAFVNIALFRTVLPLRWLHNLSNVSEVLVTGAYFGATIAWALMDAVDINNPAVCISLKLFSTTERRYHLSCFLFSPFHDHRIGMPERVIIPLLPMAVLLRFRTSRIAGMIAANQISFVVALAGKNNVITWLTGLSHEKVRCFEQLIAYFIAFDTETSFHFHSSSMSSIVPLVEPCS